MAMKSSDKGRLRVGLALGSGAARGAAHLGILRAIREHRIPVDFIAGTSIGSLVGAAYASGRIESLHEAMLNLNLKEILYYFVEISRPRGGLIDGKRVLEFIKEFIDDTEIGALPIPFRAVATDIRDGAEVVLDSGPVMDAIRASISIPGVFSPVLRDGAVLVDGGLVNPVPVNVVRDMGAEFIVAVDLNHGRAQAHAPREPEPPTARERSPRPDMESGSWPERMRVAYQRNLESWDQKIKAQVHQWTRSGVVPSIIDVLGNSIRIMEAQISETSLRATKPDVVIRPPVGHLSFMDFHRAAEAIEAGYETAREVLREVPGRLEHG